MRAPRIIAATLVAAAITAGAGVTCSASDPAPAIEAARRVLTAKPMPPARPAEVHLGVDCGAGAQPFDVSLADEVGIADCEVRPPPTSGARD